MWEMGSENTGWGMGGWIHGTWRLTQTRSWKHNGNGRRDGNMEAEKWWHTGPGTGGHGTQSAGHIGAHMADTET